MIRERQAAQLMHLRLQILDELSISTGYQPDPRALAADFTGDGDLFIADGGKLIYHFDRSADRLVPIAGDATRKGFSGDGGPAIDSRIDSPADIALDSFGNLVIADTGNSAIRAVNLSGER